MKSTGLWGGGPPRTAIRLLRPALAGCAAMIAIGAADAGAHLEGAAEYTRAELESVIGEDFERTEDGLFRVGLADGASLLTHGPDPRSAMNPFDLDVAPPGGVTSRPPVCASDYYQHVLYGHLTGTPDLIGAQAPTIRTSIEQVNALLAADSFASGGITADYKVLCDEGGQVRIDSFTAASASFADIVAGAKAAGFKDARADYTIFFDAPAPACGIGSYSTDSSLSPDNRSNSGGGYGISYQGCWLDGTPMHENAHSQGAVQPDSPNSTGTGGHCYDERDIVCYSPDGGDRNQSGVVSRCRDRIAFDCGDDDYFDSAPEPGEYLAGHWNLGSALNRFVVFGQGEPIGTSGQGDQVDPPCSTKRCAVPVPRDGSERTGLAAETGGWSFYRIAVPSRLKRLDVRLRGPACDSAPACETNLDLYVRTKRTPSKRRYDCRSAKPASKETCRVRRPRGRRFYLGVRSVKAQAGASFAISTVTRPAR